MDLELEDKLFVVGGGSKGLGRAVAEALLAEGARILVVSRNPEEAATKLGERALSCPADLAVREGVDAVVRVVADLGEIDGILVNAGGPPPGDALALDDETWERAFRLLLGNPIRLIRGLEPRLRDGSSILFIASSSVRVPIPGLDTSNVLRPAVAALAKCLSLELAPRTRVNSLLPGRLDTERVRFLDENRARSGGITVDEERRRVTAAIPFGRYGDPVEFGRVGAFLLSPAASYVTGTALQVDGGYVKALP